MLLVAGTEVDAPLIRVSVAPTSEDGLRKPSQVTIDKAMSVKREEIGPSFGRLDDPRMLAVTRLLAVFLGLA